MSRLFIVSVLVMCIASMGCSRKAMERFKKAAGKEKANVEGEARVDSDPFAPSEEDGPEAVKYLQAVKPFYLAIAEGKYDKAYDILSPHALHDVHPHQFVGPTDPDDRSNPPRISQLSKDDFVKRMKEVE